MRGKSTRQLRVFSVAGSVAAAIVLMVGMAQSASAMTIDFQNLNGDLKVSRTTTYSFSGLTNQTGNIQLTFDFAIPNISSSGFNNIVQSPGPIGMTANFNFPSGPGVFDTLSLANTFAGPSAFTQFLPLKPETSSSWVAIDSGALAVAAGGFDGFSLSDIWIQLNDVEYGTTPSAGPGQITGGTFNLLANGDYAGLAGTYKNAFIEGDGEVAVENNAVTAVPAPSIFALFAMGLVILAFGVTSNRRRRD